MGSRVRIRLFHILHFVMHFLFPLLKNSKSGVDDRGHRLRSGSPVTNLPGAAAPLWGGNMTLNCDISRTIGHMKVSDGLFFWIFHALSFEPNLY